MILAFDGARISKSVGSWRGRHRNSFSWPKGIELFSSVILGLKVYTKRASYSMSPVTFVAKRHLLTIRLWDRDFYEVILDEPEGRINYHLIEIESE